MVLRLPALIGRTEVVEPGFADCAYVVSRSGQHVDLGQRFLERAPLSQPGCLVRVQRDGCDHRVIRLRRLDRPACTGEVAADLDDAGYVDRRGTIERFVDAGGLFVTSAGNYATEHFEDTFRDEDGDGWHEFPNGSEYLAVDMAAGDTRMYLLWDEFSRCGTTDLDVWVVDKDGGIVGRGEDSQQAISEDNKSCEPIERLSAAGAYSGWHWIQVRRTAGTSAARFTIYARNTDLASPMPEGSIVDPGSSPAAFTVGAVRANSTYLTNGPETFSSWGPNARGYPKPDISGPDGLTTSVYGVTGFYGTSAATPAVAAAAALLMSADPTLTPAAAGRRLRALAASDATVWEEPDHGLGAGRARLDPPESASGTEGGCGRRATVLPGLLGWLLLRARRLEARCEPRS